MFGFSKQVVPGNLHIPHFVKPHDNPDRNAYNYFIVEETGSQFDLRLPHSKCVTDLGFRSPAQSPQDQKPCSSRPSAKPQVKERG